MFAKLAWRNVKRSARDYLIYFFTMTFITALMFAFDGLIFSKDVQRMFEMAGIVAVMVGIATFFVLLIISWLINYMVRFMLEKRGKEFGIYLLIGMEKKKISRLYMRENALLGTGAFLAGILLGMLLQQILLSVFYSVVQMDYHLKFGLDKYCVLMTAACYAGCYLLALVRCGRKFRRMNISDLMNAQRKNEEVREKREGWKRWLLPASLLLLVFFGIWLFRGNSWNTGTVLLFLVGLICVIYLFYLGLASYIICYIRKKGRWIYRGENLFLLRQFSSKIKTMWFTMGTLTSLITLSLLGCSVAMMFHSFQNQVLTEKFPFDVQVYSSNADDNFRKELRVLKRETVMKEHYIYRIYENGTNQANTWLYTNLKTFGDTYRNRDGSPNMDKIYKNEEKIYCDLDTYMKLSDYNQLRRMLSYEPIHLENGEYAIHIKDRVYREAKDFSKGLQIKAGMERLKFAGYYTEPFSQDGHNGGDYLLIVPDAAVGTMRPYYSELVVDIQGKAPSDLSGKLDRLIDDDVMMEIMGNFCSGSDTIVSYYAKNLVVDNLIPEIKYVTSAIIFPMFYIGLVFLCVALTVLSVQQLSDSAKYRFRYGVLGKMGVGKKELSGIVLKQLSGYYLCPVLFAAAISGMIALYVGGKFNFYVGTQTPVFLYFGISLVIFVGIYVVYFVATYVEFRKNIKIW